MLDNTKLINKITYNGSIVTTHAENLKSDLFHLYIDKTLDKIDDIGGAISKPVALSNFSYLSYINLPQLSYVSNSQFYNDIKLEYVSIPNCSYISNSAFMSCSNLSYVNAFGTERLYQYAFYNCYKLQEVNLQNCIAISDYAFYACRSLSSLYLPELQTLNLASNTPFMYCSNLTSIQMPQAILTGSYIASNYFNGCNNLSYILLPSTITSLYGSCFKDCYNFDFEKAKLTLNNYSYIGDYAFCNCSKLTDINNLNSMVKSIYAFTFYGTGIYNADLPYVTHIYNNAFEKCFNLSYVSIPNCSYVADYAFSNCTELIKCDLGNKLTSLPVGLFMGCTKLEEFNIPASISYIPSSTFYKTNISSINIPSSVQSMYSYAFAKCTNLTYVNTNNVLSIGASAFNGCSNLSIAILPKAQRLYRYAFANCTHLKAIFMPNISTLYSNVFNTCANLSIICITNNYIPTLSSMDWFSNTPIITSSYLSYYGSIYVPTSLVSAYQVTTNWAAYSSRITSIENLPEEYKEWQE